MDFNVYLSNINSKQKYVNNSSSKFTNTLIPGIQLNPVTDWEVALKSCILPFHGFSSKFLTERRIYTIAWIITETSRKRSIKSTHKVSIGISKIFDSKPEPILKRFINESETVTGKSFFNFMLNVYEGFLVLTGRYDFPPKDTGALKNIISVVMVLNDNAQHLFGLDMEAYTLYSVNSQPRNIMTQVVGNRKIGVDLIPSPHIKIYSDIIKPVSFGDQNLQILDILPFNASNNHERKTNELCYRSINSNDIKDISIIIHDSSNKLLENYTEHVIISLHFRKKMYKNHW